MNRFFSALTAIVLGSGMMFGADDVASTNSNPYKLSLDHLDVGLTLGSTGVGVDFSMPVIGDFMKVRAGVAYTPNITVPLHLNLMSYSDVGESTFDKATQLMESMTGYEIDREVTVNGTPKMLNFNLLFDFYPIQSNKNWHFTAGVYLGPEKVATALNDINEMSTLISVGMYNTMYDYFKNEIYCDEPLYGDYYLDPVVGDAMKERFEAVGRVGVNLGTFTRDMYLDPATGKYTDAPQAGKEYVEYKKGDRYIMLPDKKNGTVSAKALANIFRPYVGFGYGGYLDKAKKFSVSFDCGAMFWGGAPEVITHEGVDLINDVEGVRGKVGDYVDIANSMKVYPVLNFRIAYNIF